MKRKGITPRGLLRFLISDADAQTILNEYTPPVCMQSMPQLEEAEIKLPVKPDVISLLDKLEEEKTASGCLPIEPPDISPPVLIHENGR